MGDIINFPLPERTPEQEQAMRARNSRIQLHIDPDGEAGVTYKGAHYADIPLPIEYRDEVIDPLDREAFAHAQNLAYLCNIEAHNEAQMFALGEGVGFGRFTFGS